DALLLPRHHTSVPIALLVVIEVCRAPPLTARRPTRQGVWAADLRPARRGSAGGPMLGDPLFSKELENMGKQLAEVEKDLAKLAEVGKMTSRISNNPLSLHHTPFLPPIHPPPPPPPRHPAPHHGLLRRSSFDRGAHKEVTFRRSRSRPVTPTCQPARPRALLTPPGLSSTDSLGASLRAYLSEDEFYQQLQDIRQPWNIPSDTESDVLDPPEQDNSETPLYFNSAFKCVSSPRLWTFPKSSQT
ncbi:hypothetical protein KUCAC02_032689, partial [Chaenocephalus aceratus]